MMLMALSWTASCQSSINYCLPIEKARLLFEDAVKKRVLDTLVNEQSGKIALLTEQSAKQKADFQSLLKIADASLTDQKAISLDFQKHSQSFADQLKYYEKINKKQKRQNVGLKVLLGLSGAFIVFLAVK